MFDLVNRAKYDAWKALGDMSSEQAMAEYIKGVSAIFGGTLPSDFEVGSENKATPSSSASNPDTPASSTAIKFKTLKDLIPRSQPPSGIESLAAQMSRISLAVDATSGVGQLKLNRFSKGNAFDLQMWDELLHSWAALQGDKRVRCVVLTGASEGPKSVFSTGMDLSVFVNLQGQLSAIECEGRRREALRDIIIYLQDCVNQCEQLSVPVIAAVSGHCIGAGIDLICAADLRYATKDASFCVKEIDLAIVADMGTVQRLPKLVGHSRAAELCYTGRTFSGVEAQAMGLVLQTFDTEAELQAHVQQVAQEIARKSPITIRGLKRGLLYSRDHTVQDSLQQVQLWNSAMLQSHDLLTAATSVMQKKTPVYELD